MRCASSRRAKLGAADDSLGRVGIDVGIVEQAEPELVAQEAARRLVDARLADLAAADERDDDVRAVLAAELVDAGLERLQRALLPGQVLDAPGSCRGQHPCPGIGASVSRPQSVQTTPSKP